jgi:osmotically-inducible protein OsmY
VPAVVQVDDASITAQIIAALRDHAATRTTAAKITTTEGAVTITGTAASDDEKLLVSRLAREAFGTRSVSNQMRSPN